MKAEQRGEHGFEMRDPDESASGELPEMTFVTLVLSLSTSAMVHLGVAPPGSDETPEKNLPLARQTIEILEMLQQKTSGNLTEEETRLLRDVLHDLHLRYVEAGK